MDLLLAVVSSLLLGLILGMGIGVVTIAVLIVQATQHRHVAGFIEADPDETLPAAQGGMARPQLVRETVQQAPGAAPGGAPAPGRPDLAKTRQKPRCAFCEAVRARLFARREKFAAK